MEWVYAFAAAASALSAVLAWIAKIYWGKEFSSAKNEIIKSKDTQIALLEREISSLKELTPMKIREYFISVRDQLEEFNEDLKNKLSDAKTEIEDRDKQISDLINQGGTQAEIIKLLEHEKVNLLKTLTTLEKFEESVIQDKDITWNKWINFHDDIKVVKNNIQKHKEYFDGIYTITQKDKQKIDFLLKSIQSKGYIDLRDWKAESISSNKNNPGT